MSMMHTELAAKRLELLKEAVPGISRVFVLTYLVDPIAPLQVKALKAAAPLLGVTLQIQDIKTADDLPAAFEAGVREGAQGVLTTAESIFIVQRARVSELAARYRLPSMFPYSIQVTDAGGLMAYDVNYPDLQRRATTYVDKILKGTKPSDLAVQQPTKFALVINLKTAIEFVSRKLPQNAVLYRFGWRLVLGGYLRPKNHRSQSRPHEYPSPRAGPEAMVAPTRF
jgi:putative ABC transport system substrate-binding protein